jgi:hypothetical protein
MPHRAYIIALALMILAPVMVGAQENVGVARLTADKNSFSLHQLTADSGAVPLIVGRHDELGLLSADRDNLASFFRADSLALPRQSYGVSELVLRFETISSEQAEVDFGLMSPGGLPSDIAWMIDSSLTQPASEFWPGDIVAFDGSVTINGEVGGSILVVGGDLIVREAATVRGNVVVIGGILRQRGDGKIYGQVFAPGGHRRPRLSITRAWEFENEGVKWGPSFSYDRVDGARLGARVSYQKSAYSPGVSLFVAYALASETWQYRFGLSQRLLRTTDLELHAAVFRSTDTDDDSWVGRHANTIYSLFVGSDYRDYFGADGGEIGVTYKYRERGILTASYMNTDYRWMEAERGLWHLFRPDHCFRENFSTVPTNILEPWIDRFEERTSALHLGVAVEPKSSDQHSARFDASVKAQAEIAGGALGGEFDYDRWQLHAKGEWNGENVHRITARFWYGKGRRDLPPNKFFYLGGVGTIPGYSQKEFVGDEAVLASVEYRFDYWPNQAYDGGIILFFDIGRATFDDDFFDLSEFKSDFGVGLGLGEGLRIDIAKGLDHTDRDLRVSLRLWQKW